MPYYLQGDYRSGYYGRGDPGLSNVLGFLGRAAIGFSTGGPLGALAAVRSPSKALTTQGPFMPGTGIQVRGPFGTGVSVGHFQAGGGTAVAPVPTGAACPPGYHLNKSRGAHGQAKHSYCVRNRHMNPTNPRALRRAVRREHGFVAVARRVLHGTGITIGRHHFGARKRVGARR
jgi:hypothetical protein